MWSSKLGLTAGLLSLIAASLAAEPKLSAPRQAASAPRALDDSLVRFIYPKPEQRIAAVESTFVIGNIAASLIATHPDIRVLINGTKAHLHKDGGFLAWLPVTPGAFVFSATALTGAVGRAKTVASGKLSVTVGSPTRTLPPDSLAIVRDISPPEGDLTLSAGEYIDVAFHATPGGKAWFGLPGVADSIPMLETSRPISASAGADIFGSGPTDTGSVAGIYTGRYLIKPGDRVDSEKVKYYLKLAQAGKPSLRTAKETKAKKATKSSADSHLLSSESGYRVTVNSRRFPVMVRFKDTVQIVRFGPRRGYLGLFQPDGIVVQAVGAEGDWLKLQLAPDQYGWVSRAAVDTLPQGALPPESVVRSIRTVASAESVMVVLPLTGRHAFRIVEEDRRRLRLCLYGVTSDTDWIRYDRADSLIESIIWNQPQAGVYELVVTCRKPIWGYDAYYAGQTFILQFNYPPAEARSLDGKRIVIDPGHSKDPGAIGPTGLTEAEANLMIALDLKEHLEDEGAVVIMTRDNDRDLPLYDRPAIAKTARADLFLSIHNNAQPDGVNPLLHNGTAAFYYHPHSMPLARAIHDEMVRETGLPDYGLYYGNLAVARPTQYPAVLIECAFMILPEQEAMLKSAAFRERVVGAIVRGVERFLEDYADE